MRTRNQQYERVNRGTADTTEHAHRALSGDEEGHCQKSNKEAALLLCGNYTSRDISSVFIKTSGINKEEKVIKTDMTLAI